MGEGNGRGLMQITSLELIRKFTLGEFETAIKSWFAVVEANFGHFGPVISFFNQLRYSFSLYEPKVK